MQAHRFFGKLRELGVRRTGIEDRKLDSHLKFCAETHDAALKHVERVRCCCRALGECMT